MGLCSQWRFKLQDPYTAFPILAKPSGPPLDQFLSQHRENLYTAPLDAPTSRIRPAFLPLIYQWALQMISGLAFVHSHDIIFGDINTQICWLSSDRRLSLVAFLNAGWGSGLVRGDWEGICGSYPAGQKDPSMDTDLVLYGWTVYQIFTGHQPAMWSSEWTWRDRTVQEPPESLWPRLDDDCMGVIVRRCCAGGFDRAEDVKTAVVDFLGTQGWEIDEDFSLNRLENSRISV